VELLRRQGDGLPDQREPRRRPHLQGGFLLFIVIGAASSLKTIIGFSDAAVFAMSIPNIVGLYLLMRVVKRELTDYEADLASGAVSPVDAGTSH
jgi:Na+/alanine symporter